LRDVEFLIVVRRRDKAGFLAGLDGAAPECHLGKISFVSEMRRKLGE
jgi:hypothetical protein